MPHKLLKEFDSFMSRDEVFARLLPAAADAAAMFEHSVLADYHCFYAFVSETSPILAGDILGKRPTSDYADIISDYVARDGNFKGVTTVAPHVYKLLSSTVADSFAVSGWKL